MNKNYLMVAGLAVSLFAVQSVVGMHGDAIQELLFKAAAEGDVEKAEWWIDGGARVNSLNLRSVTPLHVAAEKGHYGVAMFLVLNGADVNARGDHGTRPLHKAVLGGNAGLVEYLIDEGAQVDATERGMTALHHAVLKEGAKDASVALVRRGANIFKYNAAWKTPFDLASSDDFRRELFKEWCLAHGHEEYWKRIAEQTPKRQEKPKKRPRCLEHEALEAALTGSAGAE